MKMDDKVLNGFALFASGYSKRMMQGRYGSFMGSDMGKKLLGLSRPSKLGLEAAMNGIMAFLGTREREIGSTPFRKYLFEVIKDAPSEISKRLLNHTPTVNTDHELVASSQKAVAESLLELDDATLTAFLTWATNSTTQERAAAMSLLGSLDGAQVAKFTSLSLEQRASFLQLASPEVRSTPPQSSFWTRLNGSLASANNAMEARAKERQTKPTNHA